ncbi:hypothetical protein H4R19_001355 [Coemansia spiralis]|nr:hypothetical protein H4R19_001355 [Coemansia spiralis]
MDAGLENNLPFAPLLRPERGVDVVICLDASANIEFMPWFAQAEAWAASHGVERWPWSARPWAADSLRPSKAEAELDRGLLGGARSVREHTVRQLKEGSVRCAVFDEPVTPSPLGRTRHMPQPPVTVVYLPLLPNQRFRDSAFDPKKADFCATFNDQRGWLRPRARACFATPPHGWSAQVARSPQSLAHGALPRTWLHRWWLVPGLVTGDARADWEWREQCEGPGKEQGGL